jgi:hypothetical protein
MKNQDKDQTAVVEANTVETSEKNASKLSRRAALAMLGKHAVYTTPAVLAILSLKSNSALAGSW